MPTDEQIKLQKLRIFFNTELIKSGFSGLRSSYSGLGVTTKSYGDLHSAIKKILNIPVDQKDVTYYTTSQANWEECLDIIYGIIKNFKWEEEKFDCDDRAKLVSALCSILFGLNSCGQIHCFRTYLKTGQTWGHFTNLIVNSAGGLCLFDVDASGKKMILTAGLPITMGNFTYKIDSAVF